MKNSIITLILLHILLSGMAQGIGYEVRSIAKRPIVKQRLSEVKTLSDFSQGYPNSWISEYVSVMVSTTCNGRVMEALSTNDTLSNIQMSLLKKADLGTNVVIVVRYIPENTPKDDSNIKVLNFSYTVVPDIEAQFVGGYEALKQYLKEKSIDVVNAAFTNQLQVTILQFTIDEHGQVIKAHISVPSEDETIDKLLLETISRMPKWKPAEDGNGIKVSQDFEFVVGNMGC